MKNALIAAASIILLAGYFYLGDTTRVTFSGKKYLMKNATEESSKRRAWEFQMLRDPSTGTLPANFRSRELKYLEHFPEHSYKTTANEWKQRGPWDVGGRTRTLAMDVTDEDILVAASVSGRIYRSKDQGQSWTPTLGLMDHQGIVSVAQDTRAGHEHIWYALGGEATGASQSAAGAFYFGDGVYVSTDSAQSWTPLPSTDGGQPHEFSDMFQTGWRIATSPRVDRDIIYVCSVYGIQRSDDGGQTWTIALGNFGGTSNYYSDIDISSTGVSYAALSSGNPSHQGIYRSSDDSIYTDISPTQYINNYGRIVMDINPNNENEVYFFIYMDDSTANPSAVLTTNYKGEEEYISLLKYTYLYGDGTGAGGVWEDLSPMLPTSGGGPFDKLNCQGGYDMLVKVQPITNHVYIGGTNLYFSTTGFTTSTSTRQIGGYLPLTVLPFFEIYPLHHPDQHDVVFSPTDTTLVISASDGGVRSTSDVYAATIPWENLNGGYFSSQYYSVTIDRNAQDDKTLLGGFQDNGNFITHTDDVTSPWVMPFNGDGAYNYIAKNKDFYVMSIQLGKMIKAKLDANDNIVSFTRIDPIGPTSDDYLFINPFVVDENDENYMYVPAGRNIYRQDSLKYLALDGAYDSTSRGWSVLTTLPISANSYITAIAISRSPANILYVGTNDGSMYRIDNANSSTPITTRLGTNLPTAYVGSIAIDETDADKVAYSYTNYGVHSIYYTEDGGATFRRAGGNLELNSFGIPPSVRWVSIVNLPSGARKYLAATSIGLFSSDTIKAAGPISQQTIWEREGVQDIGAAVVRHITWRASDGYVVVGTHGSGAFAKYFGYPESISDAMPEVLGAYPVPSQRLVLINLPESEKLQSMSIYNYVGQKVKTPIFDQKSDGSVELQISVLEPGVYFVRIYTASRQYTATIMKN